ncbi:MAG TPA: hypoxanthine phosphoribosyltransferase [Acholeplasmataceae bacterium]|nr:hypoxanthine phosphoribosyltransferase [Acholeplasmataceae bacterium]
MNPCIEEVLITHEMIQKKCEELGKIITEDYNGKVPILIGLLKGAVPFMAELIKYIDCDIELEFIDVSSYEGVSSTGVIKIVRDINCSVEDRHILLVDDIIDTGLTLNEVIKLLKDRKAASVETVTLVDKPEGRKIGGINPKYIGYTIPNKFVVGFGLDYNELYRNLPYIGVLKRSVYENK